MLLCSGLCGFSDKTVYIYLYLFYFYFLLQTLEHKGTEFKVQSNVYSSYFHHTYMKRNHLSSVSHSAE